MCESFAFIFMPAHVHVKCENVINGPTHNTNSVLIQQVITYLIL